MTAASRSANAVAVIGLACRVPGADNTGQFWRNLVDGVESIARFSRDELLAAGVDPALADHPSYVNAGAVLDGIELFDAALFGFGAREAEILDVQQRVFLECASAALEDAACDPERRRGAIGVYAGAGLNTYLLNNLLPNRALLASLGDYQAMIANDKDFLATRTSYKLNLRGPSLTVQTACSTSLVAVHLACQSLLAGECDMALAGGVTVRVPHKSGYLFNDGMILSPDGHCRAFDRHAAGTVGGSGAGVVVLKRLEDALADRDAIHALVLGSAVNNDGGVKVGYTAPSIDGQRAVVAEAIAIAGVEPSSISFIEAHGTGTALGDPIEFAALCEVFRPAAAGTGWCTLGSVKTNVGHLDAAAGIAGFIKTVLALRHRLIPPTLHFVEPNPQLGMADSPFRINTAAEAWRHDRGPRRAGVSSFGIGGTNAHVVLEEAPAALPSTASRSPRLFVVSARSDRGLAEARADVARALEDAGDSDLGDVAFTLQVGRKPFDHRVAVVASTHAEARDALVREHAGELARADRPIVFMFPGQGSQYPRMGASLYRAHRVFREAVDGCAVFLVPLIGVDLRDLLLSDDGAAARIADTRVAQPAIFTVEYALARQLAASGVVPSGSIGHSVGEYTAACVAGALDPYDALTLLVERGRLMAALPAGRMTAVRCAPDRLAPLLGDAVAIAAINAPAACVVSGPVADVLAVEQRCAAAGIDCHPLETTHAFHSSMMEPIVDRFAEAAARMPVQRRSRRWISNVTGSWIDGATADANYWTLHLRATVQFSSGIAGALADAPLLVEVGPGRALTALASQHPGADGAVVVSAMRHARDTGDDEEVLLRALGCMWTAGARIDWEALDANCDRRRVSLPVRPFERQRFWIDPPATPARGGPVLTPPADAADRRPIDDWFLAPAWTCAPLPVCRERRIDGAWLWIGPAADPVSAALLAELRARGAQIVVAERAGAFLEVSDSHYRLRAADAADHQRLFAALRQRRIVPDTVVHAWAPGLGNDRRSGERADALLSLIWVARLLAEESPSARRLLALSPAEDGASADVEMERGLIAGALRAISRELPSLVCRSIDYQPPHADAAAALARMLAAELAPAGLDDSAVAYRGNQRYVASLAPVALAPHGDGAFRRGAHYLITGGTGGIGLVVAGHLAQRYAARLTLVGRSALPERDRWAEWIASHPPGDRTSRRIAALRSFEESGARVAVVAADVADCEQLRAAVAAAEQRFGTIAGVVHAAGVPAGGVIARKTTADVDAVLRPKIDGALNLAALFAGRPLELLLLMSSMSAVVGDVGQVDYCAANAGLDALAHALRRDGHGACAINWDTWRESGMAASAQLPAALQAAHAERLRCGIGDAEGIEALERIVASGMTQVVVSTRDVRVHVEAIDRRSERSPANASAGAPAVHPRPSLDVPFAPPEGALERTIAGWWQALLGVEPIGVDDDFFALGGHSLIATELLSRIRDQLGVRVSLATFFDNPTIARLAPAIETLQIEAVLADLDRMSDADAERLLADDDRSLS